MSRSSQSRAYHSTEECRAIKNSLTQRRNARFGSNKRKVHGRTMEVTLENALLRGCEPCGHCHK